MRIAVLKESNAYERRVSVTPQIVKKMIGLGAEVFVQSKAGEKLYIQDESYRNVGATVVDDLNMLCEADLLLKVEAPDSKTISLMKKGSIAISFLNPFNGKNSAGLLAKQGVSTISMDMIPRTTLAQKMDALSSQANIAGYAATMIGANRVQKIIPMMMTPSGTIPPLNVFVIGAGVAGLQAIATAKRLGARVEAFDTRPDVEEQIASLGAKPIKIDLGEVGQDKSGYAEALNDIKIKKQQEAMKIICAKSDLVITTAKLFGKKAPLLITHEMIASMKPSSVIVDMAVETGGNVEGSKQHEIVEINGVSIIGTDPLTTIFPETASQMYANNLYQLITQYWNQENKRFELKREDEIIQAALITDGGEIIHPYFKNS